MVELSRRCPVFEGKFCSAPIAGRGRSQFCELACNREAQRRRQNARKFLEREGLTRRRLLSSGGAIFALGALLDAWTGTATARYERAHQEIQEMRRAVIRGHTPEIQSRAEALRAILAPRRRKDPDAALGWIHASEIIRDAVTVGPLDQTIATLRQCSRDVIEGYAAGRAYIPLVAALITDVNIGRLQVALAHGSEFLALMPRLTTAESFLAYLPYDDLAAAFLRHQVALWRFRLGAFYARTLERRDGEAALRKLHTLTVNFAPAVRLETLREELGWAGVRGDSQRARDLVTELGRIGAARHLPPFAEQSLLRPRVDTLLEAGKYGEARPLIVRFTEIYRDHPTWYGFERLRPWFIKLGLRDRLPELPRPTGESPFLPFLHLGGQDVERALGWADVA